MGVGSVPLFAPQIQPAPATARGLTLWEPQAECLDSIGRDIRAGFKRILAVLPTGMGKGLLIGEVPRVYGLLPCLVLVDRDELVEQNAEHLANALPEASIEIEKAERHASLGADCVVASVQTWARGGAENKRLKQFPPSHFTLVQSDEAHGDLAPRRLHILRYFTPSLLLAWTATAWRTDNKPLSMLYEKITYSASRSDDDPLGLVRCVDDGYLSRVRAIRVSSTVNLTNVKTRQDDFHPDDLASAINTDMQNSVIISAIEQHAIGRRAILVFCANKAHAEAMTYQLTQRGHDAGCVLDHTPYDERKRLISEYRAGTKRILVGVDVFRQGFNAPITDCIVFARPVKSSLVFCQIVGRGTRKHPGKDDCLIIDCAFTLGSHKLFSVTEMFGGKNIDAQGLDALEVVKQSKKITGLGLDIPDDATAETIEMFAERAERIAQGTILVDTVAEAADLFSSISFADEVERDSQFAWVKVSARRYQMSLPGEVKGRVATLFEDALGVWQYTNGVITTPLGAHERGAPFRQADRCVKQDCANNAWRAVANDAAWRNAPASDKQKALLTKFGIKALPPDLTKGAACHMADILILAAKNRKEGR